MRHPLAILLAAGTGLLTLAALLLAAIGGPVPSNATVGGHWSLLRDDGVRVSDRDYRGRFTLMYFGYTGCPDVCPTTLATVADAMRDLGDPVSRLQPIFVTVDPHHDTPPVLHRYVRQFGPHLIGLTGTAGEISAVESRFDIRVFAGRAGGPVQHDAVLLLVGPNGSYLAALPVAESGRAIATRLTGYTGIHRS